MSLQVDHCPKSWSYIRTASPTSPLDSCNVYLIKIRSNVSIHFYILNVDVLVHFTKLDTMSSRETILVYIHTHTSCFFQLYLH